MCAHEVAEAELASLFHSEESQLTDTDAGEFSSWEEEIPWLYLMPMCLTFCACHAGWVNSMASTADRRQRPQQQGSSTAANSRPTLLRNLTLAGSQAMESCQAAAAACQTAAMATCGRPAPGRTTAPQQAERLARCRRRRCRHKATQSCAARRTSRLMPKSSSSRCSHRCSSRSTSAITKSLSGSISWPSNVHLVSHFTLCKMRSRMLQPITGSPATYVPLAQAPQPQAGLAPAWGLAVSAANLRAYEREVAAAGGDATARARLLRAAAACVRDTTRLIAATVQESVPICLLEGRTGAGPGVLTVVQTPSEPEWEPPRAPPVHMFCLMQGLLSQCGHDE